MRILRSQPIRRQLVLGILAVLLPVTAAVLWSARRTVVERRAELEEQVGSIAVTASAYLSQYLDGIDTMARALAAQPAVRALDDRECDRLFADLIQDQPLILNIVLSGTDGAVHGSARGASLDQRHAAAPWPYVSEVIATGRPVVGELAIGDLSGKPTIVLGYPVRSQGRLAGILGIGIDLARLQTVFASIPLPADSIVTLVDRHARVLARTRDAEKYIGSKLGNQFADLHAVPRTLTRVGVDGIPRVYGNAIVERGPWIVSVGIPTAVVTARVEPLWRRNLVIAAFALALPFLLSLWLGEVISRQLTRLRDAAQRIAGGDLSVPAREKVPNLEIGQLQDTFIVMASNLREMRDALDHQVEQERRMREVVESLQRQVVRQERLAAVGVLVSGVAHELNNPLQAILGSAELLERDPTLDAGALEEVAFVKTQSIRAREIIRNLSRFSRQQSTPPTVVDLREVIAEVVQLRRHDLEASSIALTVEVEAGRPVSANFTELQQVTLNFVVNAQQAIDASGRGGGRIRIRSYDAGKRVRLEVADDGPGVARDDEPKLFQPFFTTKPVGKGTGLGLSVSYGIVDSYGGTIGYQRNEWGGATFFFELPAADPAPAAGTGHDRTAVLHRPHRDVV